VSLWPSSKAEHNGSPVEKHLSAMPTTPQQ